jgi:hypothetical protein
MLITDLVEQATIADTVELWNLALTEAVKYHRQHEQDPESYYILGFIYFSFTNRNEQQTKSAKNFFILCLDKKIDHQLALYHLGILYFLESDYALALTTLDKTHKDYFFSIAQEWRIIKIEEIKLACRLYLNEKVSSDDFKIFEKLVLSLVDPEETPVFFEIAQCLNQLLKNKLIDEECIKILNVICNLITLTRRKNIFSNKTGPFYDYLKNYPNRTSK